MFIKNKAIDRGSRARDFAVMITSCRNATLQGQVTHPSSQKSQGFRSLLELTALIHNRLEELGLAMPAMEMRSWPYLTPAPAQKGADQMNEKNDTKAEYKVVGTSFLIRIIYRQHASWQGEIHWLDGEKMMYFRSFLEMIMLMQEAIETTGVPKADYHFRGWEDEGQVGESSS